jgi:amino acid transporter
MAATPSLPKKLRILPLIAVIFLTVSGGSYGLEPLLDYVGRTGALLLLVITPVLWDVPAILTVMELNSMMPVTGGYYQWVKRALGLRWACYEGWWTWLYTFVDLAIYPQLFLIYAALFFPHIAVYKVPVCLCFIWGCAALNILGIAPVGKASMIFTVLVLIPFVLLFALSFSHAPSNLAVAAIDYKSVSTSLVGMGLLTVMWNFIGWDNVTTYAGEVDKPERTYIKAVVIAFAIVIALYFTTMLAAERSGISPTTLKDSGFSAVGAIVGGKWLATLLAAGGMVSSLGLFSAVLLSVSRVPQVMSEDKLLPQWLHKLHPRLHTPYISIIVCAIVVSGLVMWTFGELLIIDITIYFAGLLLEFISLVRLRIKDPGAHRPFKIPLNVTGLCVLVTLPVLVYFTALTDIVIKSAGSIKAVLFALGALLSGEIVWRIVLWRSPEIANKGKNNQH